MDFFEVVETQRAIRRLKPDPIPDDVIRKILHAAVCAPSGGNRQSWSFIVIRDASLKARIASLYREGFAELHRRSHMASARHLAEHMAEVLSRT